VRRRISGLSGIDPGPAEGSCLGQLQPRRKPAAALRQPCLSIPSMATPRIWLLPAMR
jgi:hypothetical protein